MVVLCTFDDVAHLADRAANEGVTVERDPDTEWFGYVAPDGRIVAVGGLKQLQSGRVFRLRGAYTMPEFRGLGIGELLSVSRVNRARDRGAELLETHSKRPDYYLRLGWVDTGARSPSGALVLSYPVGGGHAEGRFDGVSWRT